MSGLRFAIYVTGDPSDLTRENFGDYGDLFRDLLKVEGDTWEVFDARAFEYPERVEDYRGVVITGSPSTAHEPEPWIQRLNQEIVRAFESHVRVIGVCFGHQAVANALGGRSERNPNGWEAGLYELEYRQFPEFFRETLSAPPKRVLEIHSDHVVDAPPGAVVLASTPKTSVQVYYMPERILGIQGHPEFFNDIVRDLVRTRARQGIIDDKEAIDMLNSMQGEADREQWRTLMNHFLRSA